jgi:MFS family permease
VIGSAVARLLDDAPFTRTHRRVWLLSSMGIMLDGFDFFIMGVAIPLIRQEWGLGAWEVGLVSSAAIVGAIVGASTLGALTDRIGRKLAFKIDLGLFVAFALASALAPSFWWLVLFRFLLGVGIGADYPISSSYVSEIAPARVRSRLLVATFSFQAVGQLLGVVVGLAILHLDPTFTAWRWMLAFGVVPALVIVWMRRTVPESPKWLAASGQLDEAADVLSVFCARRVTVADLTAEDRLVVEEQLAVVVAPPPPEPRARWRDLFSRRWRRATVLTSVPWFLMDIATYGVGVFTPTIIAAVAIGSASADSQYIADDITSTRGAAFVDLFLVVGFAVALLLITRVGKLRLQVSGFVVMALGLFVLAYASSLPPEGTGTLALVLVGFAVFNLFMNAGPNATTYVMPAEVFATRIRAAGSGFAAAAGKTGAAVGTLLFPAMQDGFGLPATLVVVGAGCLVAAGVTFGLRSASHPSPA